MACDRPTTLNNIILKEAGDEEKQSFVVHRDDFEDFLDGFPSVKREQVIAVIEAGKLRMLETV